MQPVPGGRQTPAGLRRRRPHRHDAGNGALGGGRGPPLGGPEERWEGPLLRLRVPRRGAWDSGFDTLGYDYDAFQQMLVPKPDEAAVVRRIFEGIISLGSISKGCDDQ